MGNLSTTLHYIFQIYVSLQIYFQYYADPGNTDQDHLQAWIDKGLLLTLSMLRLISSKAQERKDFCQPAKPYLVGIHLIALAKFSQMSTHLPGFQSFFKSYASLSNVWEFGEIFQVKA